MARVTGSAAQQLRKIDWHDYKQLAAELKREGPGEQGAAVILSADDERLKHDLYKVNGFNAYASDKISLDRAIKDIRHPKLVTKSSIVGLLLHYTLVSPIFV